MRKFKHALLEASLERLVWVRNISFLSDSSIDIH